MKKLNKSSKGNKTTSKDWLNMDLEAQSGAIFKPVNGKTKRGNNYEITNSKANILTHDPVTYGKTKIENNDNNILN